MLNYFKTYLFIVPLATGCVTGTAPNIGEPVEVPFIKNSPNECYFLDEFMPVPDGLVAGRHGAMTLRYYTYNNARYKNWNKQRIILSFYSKDDRCWSLFEEYYVE